MEYFNKAKAVKLRSHLDTYLVTDDDDKEKLRQSREGSTANSTWEVELVVVEGKSHRIRLKSCYGGYLTATDTPFLLGMTGDKVVQSDLDVGLDWKYEWEPIKEGLHHVKLRSWCGKYLRGNGGTPPWRNSITHDHPYSSVTHSWILWGVEVVEFQAEKMVSFKESVVSSFDFDDYDVLGSEPGSAVVVSSVKSSFLQSQNTILQVRVYV